MATTTMYRVQQVVTGVAGSPYYMTGHFNAAGPLGSGGAQEAASAWAVFCRTWGPNYATGARFSEIDAVDAVDPVSGDIVGVFPVDVPASISPASPNPLPPMVQLLVNWRTGVYIGGREVRGKTFVPLITEAYNDGGGKPTGDILASFSGFADALIADADTEFVIYSKKQGQHYPVSLASVPDKFAVLRSRRD